MCNASLILIWNFEAAESKIVKHSVAQESRQALNDCRYLETCKDLSDKRCSLLQHNAFFVIFFKQYIIKQLLDSVFCDIRNNQGLDECYQPQPSPSADNTYLDLDYSRYHKNLIQ